MQTSRTDIVIGVMGVTGVGKSTFIQTVTGRQDITIGHGLTSETIDIKDYRFSHEGVNYVLVDTPGFDDTYRNDGDVLNSILQWLDSSYRAGTKLNGVVYLHRLSDQRMPGSALKNLLMFRRLCGPQALGNVILATTFWESLPAELVEKREKELSVKDDFWGGMIRKGSAVRRLGRDFDSAMKIVREIAQKNKVTFQAQDEMVNQDLSPQNTAAAGGTMHAEMVAEIEKLQRQIKQARERQAVRKKEEMDQRRRLETLRATERQKEEQRKQEDERRKREHEKEMKRIEEQLRHEEELLEQKRTQRELEQEQKKELDRQKLKQIYEKHKCRCSRGLVGRPRCAKCSRLVGDYQNRLLFLWRDLLFSLRQMWTSMCR